MTGRLHRLAETGRPPLDLTVDGRRVQALQGDTVLTAMLMAGPILRRSEFGPEGRAGFCLMGACQDCWVWTEDGTRLQACSTPAAAGMALRTAPPSTWPAWTARVRSSSRR